MDKHSKAGGSGLERLCRQDWAQSTETEDGVEFFEARFQRHAYQKHRRDTYAICLTTTGVLGFDYRGTSEISTAGQVVVLHPDEVHDGYAGTQEGFGYRELYVEPAVIFEAIQTMCPHPCSLPFVRTPVVRNQTLSAKGAISRPPTRRRLHICSREWYVYQGKEEGSYTLFCLERKQNDGYAVGLGQYFQRVASIV